jgi:hypothetical protein
MGIGVWKRRGYLPPIQMTQLFIKGGFSLSKVLLKNLGHLKNVRTERVAYVPPERLYELPKPTREMQPLQSDEKYLRPTLFCNHTAPGVTALAYELGAFDKNPYDYANDAFEFVKRNLVLQIMPLDGVVPTLVRGYGTCIHKISVFIALCRAAGIRARYKLYALSVIPAWQNTFFGQDLIMRDWYDAMGYFMLHGEGEAFVDGTWVVGDVGPTPERQVASCIPITRFGEDSIGMWAKAIPGSIMRMESLPVGLAAASKLLMHHISPGSVAKINDNVLSMYEKGKALLADLGGEEVYDRETRKGYKMPDLELQQKSIVLE